MVGLTPFLVLAGVQYTCAWVNTDPGFPNSLGARPLMGWRSWQAYISAINQSLMEDVMQGLAKKRPLGPNGAMVSLADIGYRDVGLDAGYEMEGAGVDGGCHDKDGHMIINTDKFPSLTKMNDMAHALKLTTSWYLNADPCNGTREKHVTYQPDSQDAVKYGFDGVKFDSEIHGADHNITEWALALNATGKQMMIENCLNKNPSFIISDPGNCPFNFYRSGPDNSPSFYGGLTHVYRWTVPFLSNSVDGIQSSRPGCFAYPDMLGIAAPVYGTNAWEQATSRGCADLTLNEERTLFANWAIVSSPLVLGMDVSNDTVVERMWPIIANERALKINSEWAGEAGKLLRESSHFQVVDHIGATCEEWIYDSLPLELVYSKRIGPGEAAILVINADNSTLSGSTLSFDEIVQASNPAATPTEFVLTEVWTNTQIGTVTKSQNWTIPPILSHDSLFLLAQHS